MNPLLSPLTPARKPLNPLMPQTFDMGRGGFVPGVGWNSPFTEQAMAIDAMAPMPPQSSGGASMAPRSKKKEQPGFFSGPPAGSLSGTPYDTMMPENPYFAQAFADGGMVMGPGGPKDDKIHAKLSDGEFVLPAEAVQFFGLKHIHGMVEKAKEGMKQIPDGDEDTEPHGPRDMREDMAEGEMDDPQGYAYGGMVRKFAEGGFVNPYADDPMLYAQRQQQARDAELAQSGITDMGGGQRMLSNRYGTGFATTSAPRQGPGIFGDMQGGTVTAQPGRGLMSVADVVPAGNPAAMPSMMDDPAARRAQIAQAQQAMIPGADVRRQADVMSAASDMALRPKGPRVITVPNANPFPNGTAPAMQPTFMAPWERDATARAERDAAIQPMLDMGMRRTDARRLAYLPIPGTDYVQNARGQTLRKPGDPVQIPAGMVPDSMTVGGVRYKTPTEPKTKPKTPKIVGTMDAMDKDNKALGIKFNMHEDGTKSVVGSASPTDAQKKAAFEYMAGRPLDPNNASDWSQAYYFASGRQPPAPAAKEPTNRPAAPGPNERHAAFLKANPSQAALFDAKFGAGAAARILGTR